MRNLNEREELLLDAAFEAVKVHWEEKKTTWLAQRYAMFAASGLLASKDTKK